MERRQLVAIVGAALLTLGALLPFANESYNDRPVALFALNGGAVAGVALMAASALSILFAIYKRYSWLWLTTLGSVVAAGGAAAFVYGYSENMAAPGVGVIVAGVVVLGWATVVRK